MSNNVKKLLAEKKKRGVLKSYEEDFALFAEEQIKIVTKDARDGFVSFKLNECQKRITDALSLNRLKRQGKVRAIILKARQQGNFVHIVLGGSSGSLTLHHMLVPWLWLMIVLLPMLCSLCRRT